MFVSSYSTYIDTSSTQKTHKERTQSAKKTEEPFSLKLAAPQNTDISQVTKLPIDYISNYKALNNKQQIQQELQKQNLSNTSTLSKFTQVNSLVSSKLAYTANSKMFSLLSKPKPALSQTPKLDIQQTKIPALKIAMLNTYIANDNYYRITAA